MTTFKNKTNGNVVTYVSTENGVVTYQKADEPFARIMPLHLWSKIFCPATGEVKQTEQPKATAAERDLIRLLGTLYFEQIIKMCGRSLEAESAESYLEIASRRADGTQRESIKELQVLLYENRVFERRLRLYKLHSGQ